MRTALTLVRRIKARPKIVFDALTTADGISHWWGPDAGPVLSAQADPRAGGRFRLRFRALDGTEHETFGTFLEFRSPTYIAMSWRWEGGVEDPGESRVEITLRPVPEGTEIRLIHSLLDNEETRRSHEDGWSGALDKLEAWLAQDSATSS